MAKYEPPVCTCGRNLRFYGTVFVGLRIKNNGQPAHTQVKTQFIQGGTLSCGICRADYALQLDSRGRLVRGEKKKT